MLTRQYNNFHTLGYRVENFLINIQIASLNKNYKNIITPTDNLNNNKLY